jgi:hypothetical protein
MADELTPEQKLAALEAEKAQLVKDKETLTLEKTKALSQVKGAEELVSRWGTEMGKQREEVLKALKEAKEQGDATEAKKLLDRIEKIEQTLHRDPTGSGAETTRTLAELEGSMTPEQQAKADAVFKRLDAKARVEIMKDPDKKKAFLEASLEASSAVPESLFGARREQKKEGNPFRALFGLEREQSFVPGGSPSGASGFAGAELGITAGEGGGRRLPGGRIPRPEAVKT